jgi:hypothetical protein
VGQGDERVLRSRAAQVMHAIVAAAGGVALVAGVVTGDWYFLVLGPCCVAFGALGMRARVEVHGDRLVVQNLVLRHTVPLEDVVRIDVRGTYWGRAPRLERRHGESFRITAYAPVWFSMFGGTNRAAEPLARELGVRARYD